MSPSVILIIRILRILIGYFVKPVINFVYKIYYRDIDKPMPLPKIKNPILLLSAQKLASKIRNKEVCFNLFKIFNDITNPSLLFSLKVLMLLKHI